MRCQLDQKHLNIDCCTKARDILFPKHYVDDHVKSSIRDLILGPIPDVRVIHAIFFILLALLRFLTAIIGYYFLDPCTRIVVLSQEISKVMF